MKNRKFFMKLSCVIALSMVGGCSSFNISNKESTVQNSVGTKSQLPKESDYSNSRFKAKELDNNTLVLIDKQTKVQYLKVVRNAGMDGGVVIEPLLNPEGGLLTTQ